MIISDTEQINVDCKILSKHIHLQMKCYEDLLSEIKQQPMSKAEKESILETLLVYFPLNFLSMLWTLAYTCKKIQDYMQQFDEHLRDVQKESFTMDMTLLSVTNDLTMLVLTYNKEILMNFNKDMGVDMKELKMLETGIFNPQSMDVLHAKVTLMNDFKEFMKKQIVEKESSRENEDLLSRWNSILWEQRCCQCTQGEERSHQ